MSPLDGISREELALLADAASDDVSFDWVLLHLKLMPELRDSSWRPGSAELEAAFSTLAKLSERGLIQVGHTEYLDGGPAGRVAPVKHVAEPLIVVRERVTSAAANGIDSVDWAFQCWVVGSDLLNEHLM